MDVINFVFCYLLFIICYFVFVIISTGMSTNNLCSSQRIEYDNERRRDGTLAYVAKY